MSKPSANALPTGKLVKMLKRLGVDVVTCDGGREADGRGLSAPWTNPGVRPTRGTSNAVLDRLVVASVSERMAPRVARGWLRLEMRNRPRHLFVFALIFAGWLHSVESGAQTSAPSEWVTPSEVLVLFDASWPDEDGNGRSDSRDVAEYYAVRRGLPKDHLLSLAMDDL